jgi:hypothetical protein
VERVSTATSPNDQMKFLSAKAMNCPHWIVKCPVSIFQLRYGLSGSARDQLETSQARWLRSRMQCGGDFGCIQSAYQDRITDLDHQRMNDDNIFFR